MITGDIIFCQYVSGSARKYDIQTIRKVVKDIAITNDGYKVDAETGIEESKQYGTRMWEVLTNENKTRYNNIVTLQEAEKWKDRLSDFPDMLVRAFLAATSSEIDKRQFFHELDYERYKLLFGEKMGTIMAQLKKPLWCGHPFALSGWFGCRKLLKGKKITERGCQKCGCFVNPHFGDYFKRLRLIAGLRTSQVGAYLGIKDYQRVEDGERLATQQEIEKLISLYCLEDWYFADILKMLYTPKDERDLELDEIYRNQIKLKFEKK